MVTTTLNLFGVSSVRHVSTGWLWKSVDVPAAAPSLRDSCLLKRGPRVASALRAPSVSLLRNHSSSGATVKTMPDRRYPTSWAVRSARPLQIFIASSMSGILRTSRRKDPALIPTGLLPGEPAFFAQGN